MLTLALHSMCFYHIFLIQYAFDNRSRILAVVLKLFLSLKNFKKFAVQQLKKTNKIEIRFSHFQTHTHFIIKSKKYSSFSIDFCQSRKSVLTEQ